MNTTDAITQPRVLVIDDNASIHEDLRSILNPECEAGELTDLEAELFATPVAVPDGLRFAVDSAYQGEEGLQRVEAAVQSGRPYAMAFVDMRMPPGWDGLETIARIWQIDPNLEVVICTAHSDHPWQAIVNRLGQTDRLLILKKPFDSIEARQLAWALTAKWQLNRAARIRHDELVKLVDDRMRDVERANEQLCLMNQELRSARDLAVAASRSKSEFLANMSHEIRTPITAILGYADILGRELTSCTGCPAHAGCGQLRRHLASVETIQRNGDHLLRIIEDILDLSKIEAGKLTVEWIAICPCEIVAQVALIACVPVEAKGLRFDIEYEGAVPEAIHTDPTRLRQILVNLIGNAAKFTETGGIRLITRLVGAGELSAMQFDVVDTGIGMTAEQVGRLFQPFMQADTSTSRRYGGTGLGLIISRRLAAMLGGGVEVVETQPGAGTRMRVTIGTGRLDGVRMLDDPRAATDAARRTSAEASRPDAVPALSGRILLAEDGPDNQRLIAHILKTAGAEVTTVANGQLALESALKAREEGCPFGLILMDMQMPVMDGYTATRVLREKGYTGPILALTAHAMSDERQRCLAAGCDGYASKPIDRQQLIATIQSYLVRQVAATAPQTTL
jgi:two-component system, sensor histidine kinase and response regulator